MDEKEYDNIYAIPPNYTDSGKLLGGMLDTRNTIETGFLILITGYPELMWMSVPALVKVVVMAVTLLPLTIVGLMGIGGDSLLQYAVRIVIFFVRRRRLHYRRVGYRYDKYRKTTNGKSAVTHTVKKAPQGKKRRNPGVHPGFHPDQGHKKRYH